MVTPPHRPRATRPRHRSTVHSLTRAGRVGAFRCGVRCRVTRVLRVVCPGLRRGLPVGTVLGALGVPSSVYGALGVLVHAVQSLGPALGVGGVLLLLLGLAGCRALAL